MIPAIFLHKLIIRIVIKLTLLYTILTLNKNDIKIKVKIDYKFANFVVL